MQWADGGLGGMGGYWIFGRETYRRLHRSGLGQGTPDWHRVSGPGLFCAIFGTARGGRCADAKV